MNLDPTRFSAQYQAELLRHIVHVPGFYRRVSGTLKITDWVLPALQFMYAAYVDAAKLAGGNVPPGLYSRHLAEAVRTRRTALVTLMDGEVDSVFVAYPVIMAELPVPSVDYMLNALAVHVQHVRVTQLQGMAFNLADPATLSQYLAGMTEVAKLPATVSTGGIRFESAWGEPARITDKAQQQVRVPTGVMSWNRAINGGLAAGRLGLIVACPGIGKTNGLLNVHRAAAGVCHRGLMLTGELQADRLKHRYQCMDAMIPGGEINRAQTSWDKDLLDRYNYVQARTWKDAFVLWDGSNTRITVSMVDQVIEQWLKGMIDVYGSQEAACADLVTIDWLDYVYPDAPPRDQKKEERLVSVIKDLGTIFRRYMVAGWTAHQGNRSAMGREILTMENTAGAFLINQATDLSIGLAPTLGDAMASQPRPATATELPIEQTGIPNDDVEGSDLFVNCDRLISSASMKNRDGAPFQVQLYQGPTLRFWDNKGAYDAAMLSVAKKEWERLLPMTADRLVSIRHMSPGRGDAQVTRRRRG